MVFIDTEIDPKNGRIIDIGAIKDDDTPFHSASVNEFITFLKQAKYICGHNILKHDLKYLENPITAAGYGHLRFIDTLHLSPLLFPAKPYHALLKDDKLQTEDINNPLNDSKKARDLFNDELAAFERTEETLKSIYYYLLIGTYEFGSFFDYIGYRPVGLSADTRPGIGLPVKNTPCTALPPADKAGAGLPGKDSHPDSRNNKTTAVEKAIRSRFHLHICENANLPSIIEDNPIELAYCLALINAKSRYSITPPWVLKNYPAVEKVMFLLRNNPCLTGCPYCEQALDIHKGLRQFFGFDSYRTFAGEPIQEEAVRAAVSDKSLLAVFPTGGGKSIAFQVPALMSGVNSKGLTVVISPLQSLMKDQVDNLEKVGITDAVAINNLLDPIEKAKSIERVQDGSASILYISPESLRSKTIEKLLLGRNVVRFVVDEAHCFSAWGQDFRVDYLYIGDFIKLLQEQKNLEESIPVSCFTATAKLKVIEDILQYFRDKLSLSMEVIKTDAGRENLHYDVLWKEDDITKYNTLRDLIDEKNCPTIVYVSRTRRTEQLAGRLKSDGYRAEPYHGKMESQKKIKNQNAFIMGDIQIMVATSAFGMGVDKKDVGMVIHYDISDSLENYVQEAGRAGRDESITAECFVLFNDNDLDKHFILLNQTRINIKEIQQIWKAIKELTKFRLEISQSALEIARKAGWDDSVHDIETRVKAAIAALEDAGYLKRWQNSPRVYANSILTKNAAEAIDIINNSARFNEPDKITATRIIKNLIANKSRKADPGEEAEARVDYISDCLGIVKGEVIRIVYLLREEGILADAYDLSAYIISEKNRNRSFDILNSYRKLEGFLLTLIDKGENILNIKELNEQAAIAGLDDITPRNINILLNFWAIINWIRKMKDAYVKDRLAVLCYFRRYEYEKELTKRHELAQFILEYLYEICKTRAAPREKNDRDIRVGFSLLELKNEFEKRLTLFNTKINGADVREALLYLSRIEAIRIEDGFMVVYNALTIERLERDPRKRYRAEDYKKLEQFYRNRIQQIHIVGEYARKMVENYKEALQFVDDYFKMNYASFLQKYFKGSRLNEIKRNITPSKFRQLFGALSPAQLKIINDGKSKYIVVAAGPGSGKTRILVHKLASLLLMEDVKHEQLLMVTFSRAAATEFKKRLLKLIGNAANFVEIKTFHSYCFDLLGRVGTLEKSADVIQDAVRKIKNNEIEAGRITKAVLVIDEAQDMDANEFELVRSLMEYNEDLRVIAVGDDDQNIFEFRGSSSDYMKALMNRNDAVLYELVENYRSKSNLVHFTNQFIANLDGRMKKTPVIPVQSDIGRIKLTCYRDSNMVTPLVNDILSEDLAGSTCVLTKTNEEAMQITGLLLKNNLPAKLIQTNEGFNLYNLHELRFLLNLLDPGKDIRIIDDDSWESARAQLYSRFAQSPNLELCVNLMKDFELTNPRTKYKTDFEIFVRESKLEDFDSRDTEIINVSTIHKAKGREFENVFLMLDQYGLNSDEAVRLLYVAMTRAKSNLFIHYNGTFLNPISVRGFALVNDHNLYPLPERLTMQLAHGDVWLDFFLNCQCQVSQMNSGDTLTVDKECCRDDKGQIVLKFSKKLIEQIDTIKNANYIPEYAKIRFIVYWKRETLDYEVRILLPELYFKREDMADKPTP